MKSRTRSRRKRKNARERLNQLRSMARITYGKHEHTK